MRQPRATDAAYAAVVAAQVAMLVTSKEQIRRLGEVVTGILAIIGPLRSTSVSRAWRSCSPPMSSGSSAMTKTRFADSPGTEKSAGQDPDHPGFRKEDDGAGEVCHQPPPRRRACTSRPGCTADMQFRIAAHRIERVAFQPVVRVVDRHLETTVPAEPLRQAGADGEIASELLERILGARRLASERGSAMPGGLSEHLPAVCRRTGGGPTEKVPIRRPPRRTGSTACACEMEERTRASGRATATSHLDSRHR